MTVKIEMHSRPTGRIADDIISVVESLTGEWFTADVAPATRRDLLFQDVLCATLDECIRAFVMFTSHDGALQITLMGTHLEYRGRGIGSKLMERLVAHARSLGFDELVTLTVPPASRPAFKSTLDFYIEHGFNVAREYPGLWQSGAIELRKRLTGSGQQSLTTDAGDNAADG
jgi:ribosomal protein S18 acetylase RimI-like enzyme